MTKSTITREQAQKIIVASDEVITALAGTNEDVHPDDSKKMCELWDDLNDRHAPPVVVRELARMALAAMDSEPVVYASEETLAYAAHGELLLRVLSQPAGDAIIPLYRHAQPAPVVPVVPVVPATLPCSVELKPGLIIGKGCKTETLLTALRRRADYNADIDAMTPEERAEHDASIKTFKAMLAAAPQEVK